MPEGTFGQALLYISELMATQNASELVSPRSSGGGEAIDAPALSRMARSTSIACDVQLAGPGIQ